MNQGWIFDKNYLLVYQEINYKNLLQNYKNSNQIQHIAIKTKRKRLNFKINKFKACK